MSQKTKTPAAKGKKKKDTASRRKMVGAVIAIIIVITMLISVIDALFQAKPQNTPPDVSLKDNISAESTYDI